jgi:hypothetical protein
MSASKLGCLLSPMAERVDEQGKGGRRLAPAGVVEVIARIRRAPVLEHPLETTLREMGLRHVLRHIGQAESRQRGIEHLESAVEDDKNAKKVTGVVYTDPRTGEEYEQPAGLVVLSAYVFGNISLLLHSGIGDPYDQATRKGAIGRNYCYQLSDRTHPLLQGQRVQPVHGLARLHDGDR